jgi:hypothetical protein
MVRHKVCLPREAGFLVGHFNADTWGSRYGSGANEVSIGSGNARRLSWDQRHLIVREELDGIQLQEILQVCGDQEGFIIFLKRAWGLKVMAMGLEI